MPSEQCHTAVRDNPRQPGAVAARRYRPRPAGHRHAWPDAPSGAVGARQRQHFNATTRPQYFTGDLAGRFVLVHLNPVSPADLTGTYQDERFASTEAYLDWHRHFGRRHYGIDSPREHRSRFDHKQIQFIRPFGDIDLVDERTRDDRFTNLERIIDNKLQLELIPYGSPTFDAGPFRRDPRLLQSHMDRLLQTIVAWPRSHIIFCGAVFEPFLKRYQVGRTQRFSLTKRDGTPARSRYRFAQLELRYEEMVVRAGLAHSYAMQGLPAEAYGREISARY